MTIFGKYNAKMCCEEEKKIVHGNSKTSNNGHLQAFIIATHLLKEFSEI